MVDVRTTSRMYSALSHHARPATPAPAAPTAGAGPGRTPEATELSQQLNAARAILKLAMLRGAPPDIDVSMAGF